MKLPRTKIFNLPVWLITAIVVFLLAIGCYFYFFRLSSQAKTLDNFPVWLMRDGKVAVYREMSVDKSKDKIKNTIVVQNLGEEEQRGVKIYEVIPKEIAEKASDLEFSIQPEIIDDDPLVLWNVGKPEENIETPSIKESLLFLPKLGAFVVEITAKAAVAKTSGICETKTAKEWMSQRGTKNPGFFDCVDYMGYIQKEVQERQTKEWQNKMEENKIVTSIDSTDVRYAQIKTKSKEIIKEIQPTPSPVASSSWDGEYIGNLKTECDSGNYGEENSGPKKLIVKNNKVQGITPSRTFDYGEIDSSGHVQSQGTWDSEYGDHITYTTKLTFSRSEGKKYVKRESSSVSSNPIGSDITCKTTGTYVSQ